MSATPPPQSQQQQRLAAWRSRARLPPAAAVVSLNLKEGAAAAAAAANKSRRGSQQGKGARTAQQPQRRLRSVKNPFDDDDDDNGVEDVREGADSMGRTTGGTDAPKTPLAPIAPAAAIAATAATLIATPVVESAASSELRGTKRPLLPHQHHRPPAAAAAADADFEPGDPVRPPAAVAASSQSDAALLVGGGGGAAVPPKKRRRWDAPASSSTTRPESHRGTTAVPSRGGDTNHHHHHNNNNPNDDDDDDDDDGDDTLDRFMEQLQTAQPDTAHGDSSTNNSTSNSSSAVTVSSHNRRGVATGHVLGPIDVSGSVMRGRHGRDAPPPPTGRAATTTTAPSARAAPSTALAAAAGGHHREMQQPQQRHQHEPQALYHPADWLSDAVPTDAEETDRDDDGDDDDDDGTDHENEDEEGRRALIDALLLTKASVADDDDDTAPQPQQQQLLPASLPLALTTAATGGGADPAAAQLRALAQAAAAAVRAQEAAVRDVGRDFFVEDDGGGVVEEAARELQAAAAAAPATAALAALALQQSQVNKKKELALAVDHGAVDYPLLVKNVYRPPRSLAALTHDEITHRRAVLRVRVRGHGAPAPIARFADAGLPVPVLDLLARNRIVTPYPIQAQCVPCILAGRDVIGIAKTGSGKTLAYALPMLRHVALQQPAPSSLQPQPLHDQHHHHHHHPTGPVALILAPARELALQIHSVCRQYAKPLGLKCTAIYGGAGVAEQIADLKRGTHIVTATPGRLIDILTMQSGKLLSLQHITYVVMDEADRMFDMGFAPQISAILAAIRPDRQIVLFSATFPKAIETLARQSLKYPVEVMVGGRSVASDNVTQHAEMVEEEDKFLRLLQILGEQVEGTKKVIVFVDTQVRADSMFEQLLRSGYSTLSLHGGKEQEDRDSTLSDFKRKDGPNVLVATGVAGRGLDVAACSCVVNYSAPNHLEAYVHQTGRTGRAENRGVSYTFVNSMDEAKFAPIICRALAEAGQADNIDAALKKLSDDFKAKVEKGEAKYAGNGFKGKGYTYDSSEVNETQRVANLEKRQALIEAGLMDPDEDDPQMLADILGSGTHGEGADEGKKKKNSDKKAAAAAAASMAIPENLTPELLALPGMKEALLRKAGIVPTTDQEAKAHEDDPSLGHPVQTGDNHWVQEFDINDYPREARWKVTQKETTSRMQDEFRTAITLKGSYFPPGKDPGPGERRIYLHLESTSGTILQNAVLEIQRMLNEETLRVSVKAAAGGATGSHKYNVLG